MTSSNAARHPYASTSADAAAAFGECVWRFRGPLHAYLSRRCPNAADDLIVDVWLAAYTSRHTFDPERGELRLWLFGVARNVLRAHLRKRARELDLSRIHSAADDDVWEAVDARLDALADGDALRSALAHLAPGDREVLLLVAWEDLSPAQAAEVLQIPQGTARSRLHRARRQLQRSFRERLDRSGTSSD